MGCCHALVNPAPLPFCHSRHGSHYSNTMLRAMQIAISDTTSKSEIFMELHRKTCVVNWLPSRHPSEWAVQVWGPAVLLSCFSIVKESCLNEIKEYFWECASKHKGLSLELDKFSFNLSLWSKYRLHNVLAVGKRVHPHIDWLPINHAFTMLFGLSIRRDFSHKNTIAQPKQEEALFSPVAFLR